MNVNGFMPAPSLRLATRDDLLAFLRDHKREELFGMDKWTIRSDYVVETVARLVTEHGRGFAYNAEVKAALALDLFGQVLSHEDAAREGDLLSLLVYNAQQFRRSDELAAAGFVPGTPELLEEAFAKKMLLTTPSGKVYRPRYVGGKLYAMAPHSRKKCLNVAESAVRLVTK